MFEGYSLNNANQFVNYTVLEGFFKVSFMLENQWDKRFPIEFSFWKEKKNNKKNPLVLQHIRIPKRTGRFLTLLAVLMRREEYFLIVSRLLQLRTERAVMSPTFGRHAAFCSLKGNWHFFFFFFLLKQSKKSCCWRLLLSSTLWRSILIAHSENATSLNERDFSYEKSLSNWSQNYTL